MIGIKVKGRFLDMKPAASTEIERKSPFFAINDYASEATTNALAFPYTPNNSIALDLPYQYYTARQKKKLAAEQYDGNIFRGRCMLVIETGNLNINNIEATEISGYILYGISDFFQDIKGMKLSDLVLGGERLFPWTTNDPSDGSSGFWQHIHESWTNETIPYVFAPVRNEGYYGDTGDVEWMNKLGSNGSLSYEFFSPLVPMIKVKYLIEQIFEESGYTVTFDLDDSQWEKLILVNLKKVEWVTPLPVVSPEGVVTIQPAPAQSIAFSLPNHVPPDKMISDFIVQLFNRYGWAPVFSQVNKTVRIVAGRTLGKGSKKDWTIYAEPLMNSSFNEDEKTFSFTNDIDSNDKLPLAPDFTGKQFLKPALTVHYLSAPSAYNEGKIRFCYLENQWFQVTLNETTSQYEYTFFADNIFNEEPANSTDTIATTISTLPVYRTLYRNAGGVDYYGFFPMMEQDSGTSIGYRTLVYQGMVWEITDDLSQGIIKYPYASCLDIDPLNLNQLQWSNVYYHNLYGDTILEVKNGIIPYWWSDFLKILQAGEEIVGKVWLPRQELINFQWDDEILIKNIPYLVKEIGEPVPYSGFVQATLKRVGTVSLTDNTIPPIVVPGVYAQIQLTNLHDDTVGLSVLTRCDVVINLYSDSAGTIPYTPPATLYIYINIRKILSGEFNQDITSYYGVTLANQTVLSNVIKEATSSGSTAIELQYTLDPSGAYHYQIL